MTAPITGAGVFSALEVAGSGLTAQRGRMNVISSNLANVHTTRGANGQPSRYAGETWYYIGDYHFDNARADSTRPSGSTRRVRGVARPV